MYQDVNHRMSVVNANLFSRLTACWPVLALITATGCSAINGTNGAQTLVDPRPAYHAISVSTKGVKTHTSHDGMQWQSYGHQSLSIKDCYDMTISPDGQTRLLAFMHSDNKGRNTLNILPGTDARHWRRRPVTLALASNGPCRQPQIRYLYDASYAILWLDQDTLHAAVYTHSTDGKGRLTSNTPWQNEWLQRVKNNDISFSYHAGALYVVWSPNSKDRIMSLRGEIDANGIRFTEQDFHLDDHIKLSNIISDGEFMYLVMATGQRSNRLMKSDDGAYWRKVATCYNLNNVPFFIPFLYQDASGEKFYLKSDSYTESSFYLETFTDCERTPFSPAAEVQRLEYFPGLPAANSPQAE
jgi:hypothetical protein